MTYHDLVESYRTLPREVPTAPITICKPSWFYVYEKNDHVYISSGRTHDKNCKISHDRVLQEKEFPVMLELYQKRKKEIPVSAEALEVSINSSYWFGIFKDLDL